MSEALREWRFYLDDMIEFAHKVLAYTVFRHYWTSYRLSRILCPEAA